MSWESTALYYRLLNQQIGNRLGGWNSAECLLYSVNFAEVEAMQQKAQWEEAAALLARAAQNLERGGAEALLLCTNTMHKVAGELEASIGIPLLHIAEATGLAIQQTGLRRLGLLGTRFTMQETFLRDHLKKQFGLELVTPGPHDQELVHSVIYDELCLGQTNAGSRQRYLEIISALPEIEGVIFGCTEIGMLLKAEDLSIPLFDTTRLHVDYAVNWALSPDPASG